MVARLTRLSMTTAEAAHLCAAAVAAGQGGGIQTYPLLRPRQPEELHNLTLQAVVARLVHLEQRLLLVLLEVMAQQKELALVAVAVAVQ